MWLLLRAAGAYTNLVKLQMQQQQQEQEVQAKVEEVLEAGGKPVTRHSVDRVLSRWVAITLKVANLHCNTQFRHPRSPHLHIDYSQLLGNTIMQGQSGHDKGSLLHAPKAFCVHNLPKEQEALGIGEASHCVV